MTYPPQLKVDNSKTEQFHIVGIGASAGGLEAFLELLRALPPQTGMAFVVVQHLEPHSESQLAPILSNATDMPVVQAEEGQSVEPNHVYVIPPNTVMFIEKRALRLAPRPESLTPHYPIDRFFESLAADQGSKAIGVVLSGSASDGAQGIRVIKSRFGTTFSQDERSAKYGGMPHSAIATGAVDFVLTPTAIAEELSRIGSHPYLTSEVDTLEQPVTSAEDDGDLRRVLDLLKSASGIDFVQYKQSTLRRRIGRRLVLRHLSTLGEYLDYLRAHPSEIQNLYRDVLISVTSFFREPGMFHILSEAISGYLSNRSGRDSFRLWVPGCATGEEAYSLAITVLEVLDELGMEIPVQIFGTDISETAIDKARAGSYSLKIEQEIPPEHLRRFFSRVDSGYRISQHVRECCIFARHDLSSDPPFSQMDLVSCRNVFIYLNATLQERILPSLHYSLKPGGLLVLGSAETVGNRSDLFAVFNNENKIYTKNPVQAQLSIDLKFQEPVERPAPTSNRPGNSSQTPAIADMEFRAARILRDLYAPPGVTINREMQVLHFHGQTEFFLERVPGEASLNLLRLARESLIHPLRRAIDVAFEKNRVVHESGIEVRNNGEARQIRLTIIPTSDRTPVCIVLFEQQASLAGDVPTQERLTESDGASLVRAEKELAQTRDYLRMVVEQNEAATEELRAANEEARSSNEELQSTNEELRTAKEELQSSNEELTTVNDELRHRYFELDLATNDLSNILSAATIPILMIGMDLNVRRFTPAAEPLLGLISSDVGRTITDIRLAFHIPGFRDILVETIRTLAVQQHRAQDRNGRWYNVFFRPYRTIDDRIDGAVITFIDIDESIRALGEAEYARDFAEGIVETVQHPLLVLDSNLRVLRATEAFYTTFRVGREETVGSAIYDLGSGQWKLPELRRLLEEALVRDIPFRDLEITHEFPNLGNRTMRLHARRIGGSDGLTRTVLLAIEDVTDRKEIAEIQYRRLFESAKDGIVVIDASSGEVVDVNPYFLELCRYQRSEILGRNFAQLPPFLDVEEGRTLVPETLEKGNARYDTVRLTARDGREILVEVIANTYRVRDLALIQANVRDVTERRRTEEELRRSNLDLQQFAFAASHDLQEPLRTVISFLELFKRKYEGQIGPEADQQIGYIITAADHMRHLVLDLLAYSQVARADLNPRPVSAEAILSSVLMNLQLAIRSSNARITFDHLPVIEADQIQIVQLFQNLISNSIKYRRAEPPRIHIKAREAGPEWIFSISDNGMGIDPRYSDHIFTVFKRLHGREYPGTGIGLAICKRIVERQKGRIWVESQPDQGATFFFTIPKGMVKQH